jgi:hypothetical protein
MADTINERTIVILVISLVIIVLIATIISKLRDSDALSAPIQEDDAPAANNDEPITLSSSEIVVKQGSSRIINIGVYNPTDETVNDINLMINCNDPSITGETSHTLSIPPHENTQIAMLIKTTTKTTQDIQICTIGLDGTLSTVKNADLIIRII